MKRGFTLVEMMVVIGIVSLLLVVGSVNIRSFQSRSQVTQAAEELASILREAQSRSMTVVNGQTHGIHFESGDGTYTLFEGTPFSQTNATNVKYSLDASIQFSNIALTGGGKDVIFDKLTGSTSHSGGVTISSKLDGSIQRTITITSQGKISGE